MNTKREGSVLSYLKGLQGRLSSHLPNRLGFRVAVKFQRGNGILYLKNEVKSPVYRMGKLCMWRRPLLIDCVVGASILFFPVIRTERLILYS